MQNEPGIRKTCQTPTHHTLVSFSQAMNTHTNTHTRTPTEALTYSHAHKPTYIQ